MAEQIKPPEVGLRFLWSSVSPDPHNVTMRSNLEPVDVIVELLVPMTKEYLANAEAVLIAKEAAIKAELGVDDEKVPHQPRPVLTVEGMRYVFSQLSMSEGTRLEETEDSDDDWDEDEVSDESTDDDDDFDDDDEDWDED